MGLCDRLGLSAGWECLDVGAGTGSLALALADVVGPTGTVVAVDVDTRFLDPIAGPNLQVVRADVTAQPLPEARFDLVHARLVLENLPACDAVRLQDVGLIQTSTQAESLQVRADKRLGVPQWELLVDQLAPGLIASGLLHDGDLERFHALWHDGESVCFAPLLVSSWGRRPISAGH